MKSEGFVAKIVRSTRDERMLSIRAWDPELNRLSMRSFQRLLTECFEEGDEIVLRVAFEVSDA